MKKKLAVESKNLEFHVQTFLLLLNSGVIIMALKCVKEHLLRASGSMALNLLFYSSAYFSLIKH